MKKIFEKYIKTPSAFVVIAIAVFCAAVFMFARNFFIKIKSFFGKIWR